MATPMAGSEFQRASVGFLVDAIVTLTAVLLAFAAFDDITTDDAASFTLEYVALAACGLALAFVAARLFRAGHSLLAAVSVAALAAAAWGQRAIRPGLVPGFEPEHVVTAAALLWFAALSLVLLALGWRAYTHTREA